MCLRNISLFPRKEFFWYRLRVGNYRVKKEFSFDSAHRLVNGYSGKCSNLHGHTWKVRIESQAKELDQFGFVRDFSDFKPLKDWIDAELDHATIISVSDVEVAKLLQATRQKYFIVHANPTSENLCKLIFDKALELHLMPSAVEIDETCTSHARYDG